MGYSKFDTFYRRLIFTKFYTKGWGNPETLKKIFHEHRNLRNRDACCKLISQMQLDSVHIDSQVIKNNVVTIKGHFDTPLYSWLPNLVNPNIKTARFEFLYPQNWQNLNIDKGKKQHSVKQLVTQLGLKPVCIHMAGTGDHGFGRRRELIAKPLLKSSGIASLILENPYYGTRKPKEQMGSGLLHVTDLFILGCCIILESQILLRWLKEQGFGPLGLTGISMGGHMACLAASNWPEPITLVPCLSWTSSSVVWTEGVLSKSIPWKTLEMQLIKDFKELEEIYNDFSEQTINKSNDIKVKLKEKRKIFADTKMKTKKSTKDDKLAMLFMKEVMDQFTHLGNYSTPVDPSLATFFVAENDAYYPTANLTPMTEIWPGCEVSRPNVK